MSDNKDYQYDVFISYTRRDRDMAFVRKMEKALRNYQPPEFPGVPQRQLNVFRDENELVGADYYESIDNYLSQSAKLLVICSPESRKSDYVNDERRRFCKLNNPANIIPVMIYGVPNNEVDEGRAAEEAKCFPDTLLEVLKMPLAVDYLDIHLKNENVDSGRYYTTFYSILANIYGVSKSKLMKAASDQRNYEFDAFISYSRSDMEFAEQLEKALDNYMPKGVEDLPQRYLKVFRDANDLIGADYFASIDRYINSSANLIVICSPRSATSYFVNDEVRRFISSHDANKIIPIIIEGIPNNEVEPGQEDLKAFPEALYEALDFPLAISYRNFSVKRDKINKGAFSGSWYSILAGIYDRPRSELEQRVRKREQRRLFSVFITTLLLVALFFVLTVFAVIQSIEALDNQEKFRKLSNFTEASSFEQKAALAFQRENAEDYQKAWLYTLAALGKDIDTTLSLPVSQGRLFRNNIAQSAGIYHQLWVSPVLYSMMTSVAYSNSGPLVAGGFADGRIRIWNSRSGEEIYAWNGHDAAVTALVFDPLDNERLITGSKDKRIHIWQIRTNALADSDADDAPAAQPQHERLMTLSSHDDDILVLAVHPGGEFLVSTGRDRLIRVWDLSKGKIISNLDGHKRAVWCAAFNPRGDMLVTAGDDRIPILWAFNDGRIAPSNSLLGHRGAIRDALFSPDGNYLLTGALDSTVMMWNLNEGYQSTALRGHQGAVWSIDIAENSSGFRLASAATDKSIRLWQFNTANAEFDAPTVLQGHSEAVLRLAFSSSGDTLASFGQDHQLRLWDCNNAKTIARMTGHYGDVNSVVFSPDGKWMVSASDDNHIIVWDLASGRQYRQLTGHTKVVSSLAFSPDGRYLASGAKDYKIHLWDFQNDFQYRVLTHSTMRQVRSVAFSKDGKLLASGSKDKVVRLWDPVSGRLLRQFRGHRADVRSVVFHPNGRWLASCSSDRTIRLWNHNRGALILTLLWHDDTIWNVNFSHNGNYLASASRDQRIGLWDINQIIRTLYSSRQTPDSLLMVSTAFEEVKEIDNAIFQPGGHPINAILKGQDSRTWTLMKTPSRSSRLIGFRKKSNDIFEINYVSSAVHRPLLGHEDDVWSLAFSSDDSLLASGSDDDDIRLWYVPTASPLNTLRGHTSDVWSVAFSPDGRHLASGSGDNSVRLWDIAGASRIATRGNSDKPVRSVTITDSGKTLVYGGDDGYLRFWDIPENKPSGKYPDEEVRSRVWDIVCSPDNKWLAHSGGNNENDIAIRNLEGPEEYRIRTDGDSLSLAFRQDGLLAIGSNRGSIYLWHPDYPDQKWQLTHHDPARQLKPHHRAVRSLAFSNDGRFLASGSSDETIYLWQVVDSLFQTEKRADFMQWPDPQLLSGHTDGVWSVAFSPDGTILASGAYDNHIRLWNTTNGAKIANITGHTGAVFALAFINNNILASGSRDHSIRLWDINSGSEVDIINVHQERVYSLALSWDKKYLASGSWDQTIHITDLFGEKTARQLQESGYSLNTSFEQIFRNYLEMLPFRRQGSLFVKDQLRQHLFEENNQSMKNSIRKRFWKPRPPGIEPLPWLISIIEGKND